MYARKEKWVQTGNRKGNESLEKVCEKFATCLVKTGLETIYGRVHEYVRGEKVPGIHHPDHIEMLPKGSVDSWFCE